MTRQPSSSDTPFADGYAEHDRLGRRTWAAIDYHTAMQRLLKTGWLPDPYRYERHLSRAEQKAK